MARLTLIVNPAATRVTTRKTEAVRRALEVDHKVDVEVTSGRGHATDLAREAVLDGCDAIVVVGGDGTLAETFPALLGDTVPLGVVPGGGTNVLARSLGISEHGRRALAQLQRALILGPRRLGLGRATLGDGTERLFGFVAGAGFDAAAVRLVEQRARFKRVLSDVLYVACALEAFFCFDRNRPALSVTLPSGDTVDGVFHLMVTNTSPYTFFGSIPLAVTPEAAFDRPLSLAAFRRMSLPFTLSAFAAAMRGGTALARMRGAIIRNDLTSLTIRADPAMDVQMDGDLVGAQSALRLVYEPEAIAFLA